MLTFIDSFAHYASGDQAKKWTIGGSGVSLNPSGGRDNRPYLSLTGSGPMITLPKQSGQSQVVLGVAYRNTLPYWGDMLRIGVAGDHPPTDPANGPPYIDDAVTLRSISDGTLYLHYEGWKLQGGSYSGIQANSGIITLPPDNIQVNQWYYLELKLTWSGSDNAMGVELRVNEQTVFSDPAPVFVQSGTGYPILLGDFSYYYVLLNVGNWQDLYVLDDTGSHNTDYLGDSKVICVYPRADGSHTDWTPDTGTDHYARVNEHPPDDATSYVHADTAGAIDTYFFDAVTLISDIQGVQLNTWAQKEDAGQRQIAAVCVSGGADHAGANVKALNTSWGDTREIWERNPDGGGQWTPGAIDAAEFGVKLVT